MKVFLSSTAEDLGEYRKVADDTVLRLAQESLVMERFGARPETPIRECERMARESDIVICIVAHRYGSIPEVGGSSFTQREVEAAHAAGKKVLAWIVADDCQWTERKEQDLFLDSTIFGNPTREAEVKERIRKLVEFKTWLRNTVIHDSFTTPDELGRKVAIALQQHLPKREVASITQDKISIARLPITSPNLFGREAELDLLDKAWTNPNTNIVSFVAWGGVGKTALVNHWVKQRMASDTYRGAERVYGWSFFSQGSTEGETSADLFIDQALRWFCDPDPTSGSPWDKGERLARNIRQSRTLLILDGLEPLQHPPGPQEGRLKDAAMQALLVELAAQQPGLCVISTRERIGDLIEFEEATVYQHNIEHLSPTAGRQILQSLNVKGDDQELEEAASELKGHAFSLTLLGSYLDEVLNGDIKQRRDIQNLFDDTRYGGDAENMIAAYEKWLGEGRALAILRLLGLFDRPADLTSIGAVLNSPAIPGLTEPLQQFKGREWNQCVGKLRRIKLLAAASPDEPGTLDAHPLIREYFKQQLKSERPEAWREGNNRLYEHLKRTAKAQPETMAEMSVLYAAMTHGCAAGKYKQVLNEVYRPRIHRNREFFSIKKLGAAGTELAVLAGFFEIPWETLASGLEEADQAWIRATVGFHLQAVGRLREALQITHAALDSVAARPDWKNGCIVAANLSEIYLNRGDISQALNYAKQGVSMADMGGNWIDQMANRTVLAEALHQAGLNTNAEQMFLEAELLQKREQPQLPLLHSLEGFRYLVLLLDQVRFQEVQQRAIQTIEWVRRAKILVDIAHDELALGIARLRLRDSDLTLKEAGRLLQSSVEGLRKAGYQQSLPRGLLARAEFHRISCNYERARHDLAEVFRISTRAGMGLYLADYYMESTRLLLAQDNKAKAREHLATAKEMIDRMGYHRRDKEAAELEAQLA